MRLPSTGGLELRRGEPPNRRFGAAPRPGSRVLSRSEREARSEDLELVTEPPGRAEQGARRGAFVCKHCAVFL
ncbi:MAG: hypothetical protein KatS3mg099_274 [Candidatus Parcubacteria bacterium]|nr:MAG: hypothetical protein KatS3mg099_274 [Candidatus Parcubacteria bacterium]GIW68694.1 MAG: hypothetical protein KatS3mg100_188 [Candidatus Parcubacteria bacterium]